MTTPAPAEPRVSDDPPYIAALRHYQQADDDGVMVLASRQAIDETLAAFASLAAELAAKEAEVADKRLVASGNFRAKALAWWKATRSSRVKEVYVKGDGYLRFEWDDGAEGGSYHVPIETVLNATAEAALKAAREALSLCIDSLEYVNRNHPECTGGGVRDQRISIARAALTPKES